MLKLKLNRHAERDAELLEASAIFDGLEGVILAKARCSKHQRLAAESSM